MAKKKEIKDYSYEELEKEIEDVLTKLSDSELGLDESTKLYKYGKDLIVQMENRLTQLEKEVSDKVEEN